MHLLTLIAAAMTAVSVTAQQSNVIMQIFSGASCTGNVGGVTVLESQCRQTPNPFQSFRFVPGSVRLAPDCRVVFNSGSDCRDLSRPIDVNDRECFSARDLGGRRFVNVFCS